LQTEPKLAEKVTRNDAYMMFSEIKPILTWHVEVREVSSGERRGEGIVL